MRDWIHAALLVLLAVSWTHAAEKDQPPGRSEIETRAVSPEGRAYLEKLRSRTPFGRAGFDLERLRAGMGSRRPPADKNVQLIPTQIDDIPGEWVLAPGADPDVRLLYLHGGGFVSGSGAFYLTLAAHLSEAARCAVLLPDYRLAPEHPFPAGLEDCVRAHQWMLGNGPSGAGRAKATFIAGDSAGGSLTLATLLSLRDQRMTLPAGGIPLSASTDLTLASESLKTDDDPIISSRSMPKFRELYLGKTDPSHPLASPVFGDYRGIPPLLIQVGEHEMLRDDSIRVAKKAQADGISAKLEVWPGMFHVFHSHEPLLPEAREAIQHIAEFMRSRVSVLQSPVAAVSPKPIRVLFVGNSQIFYNDLPNIVAALADSAPADRPRIEVDRAVTGGASLESHWAKGTGKGTARGKIAEEKYDYVILQDIYHIKPESFHKHARLFDELIRENGAKTILLGTATISTLYPQGFHEIYDMHIAAGEELKVPVAAGGKAWLTYWGDDPSPEQRLALYAPDKAHPGKKGSYIYACTLYAALTGQSPVGLTHRNPKPSEDFVPAEEARQYQEAAWRVHQEINGKATSAIQPTTLDYSVQLDTVTSGFDGKTGWVAARGGIVPGAPPSVVLTMQKLLLTGSDVFYAVHEMRTDDLGKTWSPPLEHQSLGRRQEPGGVEIVVGDFTPKWHVHTGKLLGTGPTVRYQKNASGADVKISQNEAASRPAYSIYDPKERTWTPWEIVVMPEDPKFFYATVGASQRVDLPDGTILLPFHFKTSGESPYHTAVMRCAFDGRKLTYVEHGDELSRPTEPGVVYKLPGGRQTGVFEPSLTRYRGRYFLTMRNDRAAYVATSDDGLSFGPVQRWRFDDGSDLGSQNTQQHWVTHSDGLLLVYTRTGANNDHVFRHRAPLFIAQVDPEKLQVIRRTERVLVPERGAGLGNAFGVTEVSENETWVTTAEWMQGPKGILMPGNQYGSDNSVYAARILWKTPNREAEGGDLLGNGKR